MSYYNILFLFDKINSWFLKKELKDIQTIS